MQPINDKEAWLGNAAHDVKSCLDRAKNMAKLSLGEAAAENPVVVTQLAGAMAITMAQGLTTKAVNDLAAAIRDSKK